MAKMITSKSIFAILIIMIVTSFIVSNLYYKKSKFDKQSIKVIDKKEAKGVLDIRIHKQNNKGEKFLIVAETLKEKKNQNVIELKNSITTINKNDIITKIFAEQAIISNNYSNFSFSHKVRITKKSKNFTLITNSLNGSLEKGELYTNDVVDIIAGNTKIDGKGLHLKNNGEYIKIKGKAKLKMLLFKKNEN